MAKQCIIEVNIVEKVQVSAGPPARFNWKITWTNVNSLGMRQERNDFYINKSAAELWTIVSADCNAWQASTVNPPPPPPKEMPGVYDPTIALFSNATMDPADYPPGVVG